LSDYTVNWRYLRCLLDEWINNKLGQFIQIFFPGRKLNLGKRHNRMMSAARIQWRRMIDIAWPVSRGDKQSLDPVWQCDEHSVDLVSQYDKHNLDLVSQYD